MLVNVNDHNCDLKPYLKGFGPDQVIADFMKKWEQCKFRITSANLDEVLKNCHFQNEIMTMLSDAQDANIITFGNYQGLVDTNTSASNNLNMLWDFLVLMCSRRGCH